jgi:nicotinamidase-related amidase
MPNSLAARALDEPIAILTELPSALLLVDCQNRFACEPSPDGSFIPLPVVSSIEDLLTTARALGVPRFYVTVGSHMNGPYDGVNDTAPMLRRIADITGVSDPGQLGIPDDRAGQEIVESLRPQAGEVWITKQRFSAFYETGLEIILRSAGVEALVVCGVASYGSIYTTCIDANMRGFFAFVPGEATYGDDPVLHQSALNLIGSKNVIDIPTVRSAWESAGAVVPA